MPFASERQRKFLWAKHPEIAKRWAEEEKGHVEKKSFRKKHKRKKKVTYGS